MELNWRDLPSLTALRAFEATARLGTFAAAARSLNVTHAAVAQQVRALEAELGVPLVYREGRGVALTEPGAELARRLGESFVGIANAVDALRADKRNRPLQIASTPFMARTLVMPHLEDFWKKHPDILVSMTPSEDVIDIVGMGMDLGLRAFVGDPNWPGLDAEFLVSSDLVVVGTPALLARGDTMADLPWVVNRGSHVDRRTLKALGLDIDQVRAVDFGTPFMSFSMVREGLGLTFCPEILVRSDLERGVLQKMDVPPPFQVSYFAATPKGVSRPEVRAFVTWLKGRLREG